MDQQDEPQTDFDVAARLDISSEDAEAAPPRSLHGGTFQRAARRVLGAGLVAALAAGGLWFLGATNPPPREDQSAVIGQATGSRPAEPGPTYSADLEEDRALRVRTDRRRIYAASRRASGKRHPIRAHLVFDGGRSGPRNHSFAATSAPSNTTTHTTTPSEPEAKSNNGNGSSGAPKPAPPEADVLLRRLYNDDNDDHFHTNSASDTSLWVDKGYEVVETIGYVFAKQVKGTVPFGIEEGLLGYVYARDQGDAWTPLWELRGPDWHDYQLMYTSDPNVRAQFEGDGWQTIATRGYVRTSPGR